MRSMLRGVGAMMMACGITAASRAEAAGLTRAVSVVSSFMGDLRVLIPALATAALMLLGLAFSLGWIRLKTLGEFAAGIIFAGSASEIVAMLFS